MMSSDEQAQKEAAQRLRETIEALKHPKPEQAHGEKPAAAPKTKSLRDAVHDRMIELDGKPHA